MFPKFHHPNTNPGDGTIKKNRTELFKVYVLFLVPFPDKLSTCFDGFCVLLLKYIESLF